jgi:hypothetical protein
MNKIVPGGYHLADDIREFDKHLLKTIATRRAELEHLSGLYWLVQRIRIEFYAWKTASQAAGPWKRRSRI